MCGKLWRKFHGFLRRECIFHCLDVMFNKCKLNLFYSRCDLTEEFLYLSIGKLKFKVTHHYVRAEI